MPGTSNYQPTQQACLINDSSDPYVTRMSRSLEDLTEMYMIQYEVVSVDAWKATFNVRTKIAFIVSMDTELFHREIKRSLIETRDKDILLILVYHENMVQLADKTIKQIRKERRNKTGREIIAETRKPAGTRRTSDNLQITKVKTDEIADDLWSWFPHLLQLMSSRKPPKRDRRKEVGVFYKIDSDKENEFDWFIKQKNVLENVFGVTCEYSDPQDCDDEDFVNSAECVVIYVSKTSLKTLNTLQDKNKVIISLARDVSCKLVVFFEKIHDSFDKVMSNYYKMGRAGDGPKVYCIELLTALGIVNINRRPDLIFYSSRHPDNNHLEIYNQSEQQLDRAQTIYSRTPELDEPGEADESGVSMMDSLHRPPSRLELPNPTRSKTMTDAIYVPPEQYSCYMDQPAEFDGDTIERTSCCTCLKRVFPART